MFPSIKFGTYITNHDDEYDDIETHWVASSVKSYDAVRVEHISEKITNTYRIQAHDWIMRGFFCIRFINFMLNNKKLTDFTGLFPPNNLKKEWQNDTYLFSITY